MQYLDLVAVYFLAAPAIIGIIISIVLSFHPKPVPPEPLDRKEPWFSEL
jgi:hypothetical protein